MTREPDYEVGYRRPPKHSRFQKGSSGNPRGRPRKQPVSAGESANLRTAAQRLVASSMPYKRDGQLVHAPGDELFVQKLFTMAMNGNLGAMRLFISLVDNDNVPGGPTPGDTLQGVAEPGDEAIITRFLARQGRDAEGATIPGEGGENE